MASVTGSDIVYPSSDGKRMADNTLQFEWMVTIKGGLDAVFAHEPNVFVAGDLLWYPVEGEPSISAAPDTMVVFGRPKGHRLSYKQWEEDGIAPQVVFEILSQSNTPVEMLDKQDFYETHGVDEFYIWDPKEIRLFGFIRKGSVLRRIHPIQNWNSPLLKIRFELGDDLTIYGPDNQRFLTFIELVNQRNTERERADTERLRAETEKQRADAEKQRADQEALRIQQLLDLLRSKGINPDELNS